MSTFYHVKIINYDHDNLTDETWAGGLRGFVMTSCYQLLAGPDRAGSNCQQWASKAACNKHCNVRWLWWHMSVIPNTWEAKAGGLWLQGQPGLHSEVQASLGYIGRARLQNKRKTAEKDTKQMLMFIYISFPGPKWKPRVFSHLALPLGFAGRFKPNTVFPIFNLWLPGLSPA